MKPSSKEDQITFHTEEIEFELSQPDILKKWILDIIKREGKELNFITYIFCPDTYLHRINLQYLQHDYFTDIITFPYHDNPIEADIYISIDRVQENTSKYSSSFVQELHRVMIHGVLHLLGYDDHSTTNKVVMTRKENECLTQLDQWVN